MYVNIYYGYAWVCTVGFIFGFYVFLLCSCGGFCLGFFVCLFVWFVFKKQNKTNDCFVHKGLQFPLFIVNCYKSVKWHLRLKEIFHLLNMEQIVTNILVASAVGRKRALEQKM